MWQLRAIIPSALSAARLLISFAFPFFPQNFWVWLIVGAGVSDVADGWLARRWKVESWQGGLLDAVSDKVFVFVVLCVLVAVGKFSPLWIPIVLARDIVVAITSLYVLSCGTWQSYKKIGVHTSGKIATGGQFSLFLAVLLYPAGSSLALVVSSACSVWAACAYSRLFYQVVCQQLGEKTD